MVIPYSSSDSARSQSLSGNAKSNDSCSYNVISNPETESKTLKEKKITPIDTSSNFVSTWGYNTSNLISLSKLVPENLKKLLDNPPDTVKGDILFNTFSRAEKELNNRDGILGFYVGKDKDPIRKDIFSYNFTITTKGKFVIGYDFLAEGGESKVKKALDVTNLNSKLVQHVTRGDTNYQRAMDQFILMAPVYKARNSYIMNPNETLFLTETATKPHENKPSESKYITSQERMESDLGKVSFRDVKKIVQYIHDYASGLAFLHSLSFIHCDVKPYNALINGNRAVVTDFGMTKLQKQKFDRGTPEYLPPECLIEIKDEDGKVKNYKFNKTYVVDPSIDSYSLGITILRMICPNFYNECNKYGHRYFGFLSDAKRKEFFDGLQQNIDLYIDLNKIDFNKDDATQLDYKNIREKLIELAQQLVGYESSKGSLKPAGERLSCAAAVHALTKITKIDTTPPAN